MVCERMLIQPEGNLALQQGGHHFKLLLLASFISDRIELRIQR